LYKHIKIDGQWRYGRAAVASNNKAKPHIVQVGGQRRSTRTDRIASVTRTLG
jgi:hypothetical protein